MPDGKAVSGFSHCDKRSGTTTLFAALDMATAPTEYKNGKYSGAFTLSSGCSLCWRLRGKPFLSTEKRNNRLPISFLSNEPELQARRHTVVVAAS